MTAPHSTPVAHLGSPASRSATFGLRRGLPSALAIQGRSWLGLCVLAALIGCGSEDTVVGVKGASGGDGTASDGAAVGQDGGVSDSADPDGGGEVSPTGKAIGEECLAANDCASGICAHEAAGKVCAGACKGDGDCTAGMTCAASDPLDTASPTACVSRRRHQCLPCTADAQCEGGTCVLFPEGKGSYCAGTCAVSADCGAGATCADLPGIGKRCLPTSGACTCTALAIYKKSNTICQIVNAIGACNGERACGEAGLSECKGQQAVAELCNSSDDDCDGKTDDDVLADACSNQNEAGVCKGTQTCAAGKIGCNAATPAKETCNGNDDDCDAQTDEGFVNTDNTGGADCVDEDDDDDGAADLADNCTLTANKDQLDTNKDLQGDACDDDDDGDTVKDATDNCSLVVNANQLNTDKDGQGDACDDDDDDDTVKDAADNCPLLTNKAQDDTDKDGKGDLCDDDDDDDGVADLADNCTLTANKDQLNTDKDGQGDACDEDDDGDSFADAKDNCPLVANNDQLDTDKDGQGDVCDEDDDADTVVDLADNCTLTANKDQLDTDADKLGDACDDDDDGDTVVDLADNCTLTANTLQKDNDGDKLGDACDDDDDDDKVLDAEDNCAFVVNTDQQDKDKDKQGDACDQDDDNDGKPDSQDNCPLFVNADQLDTDKDAAGDVCDDDDDNDNTMDSLDCAPLDAKVKPGNPEICNGKDDNCDSTTDEENAKGCGKLWFDKDKDGFTGQQQSKCLCKADGFFTVADKDSAKKDCDDNVFVVNPGIKEICEGKIDENCDGNVDEDGATKCVNYYVDVDGDAFGTGNASCKCVKPASGFATVAGDCYDKSADVKPGQTGWFTKHRGDNSFDYDCNLQSDLRYPTLGKCAGTFFFCGSTVAGWDGDKAPACGTGAKWLSGCTGIACSGKTLIDRTQECH